MTLQLYNGGMTLALSSSLLFEVDNERDRRAAMEMFLAAADDESKAKVDCDDRGGWITIATAELLIMRRIGDTGEDIIILLLIIMMRVGIHWSNYYGGDLSRFCGSVSACVPLSCPHLSVWCPPWCPTDSKPTNARKENRRRTATISPALSHNNIANTFIKMNPE